MDFMKAQLDRIGQQVAGLGASQKMLAGMLVVVIVLTLMLWSRYAGTSEMTPVFDQPMNAVDAGRIQGYLRSVGIESTLTSDNRVMVPAARQAEALAGLTYNRLQPKDTSAAFDRITAQMTPWNSNQQSNRLWNEKRQLALQLAINAWPEIDSAMVLIDVPEKRSLAVQLEPSATVTLTMKNGTRPSRQLVQASADLVAGAVSGLRRSKVRVIADGATYPVADESATGISSGGDILEQKQSWERHFNTKIREHLAFIPDLMVAVSVELNVKSSSETRRTVDTKNVLQKEVETTSKTEESTQPGQVASEPGAIPNTGLAVPGGAGGSGSMNSSSETAKFEVMPGLQSEEKIVTPPGDAKATTASVQVPRSHFVEVWRRLNPAPAAAAGAAAPAGPTDEQLQQLIQRELPSIRAGVKACTGLADDAAVTVGVYTDVAPVAPAGEAVASAGVMNIVSGYGREIAIGTLAAASMLMVSMLARKSGGPAGTGNPSQGTSGRGEDVSVVDEGGPAAGGRREPRSLGGGDDIAGVVPAANPFLSGIELDDDAVQIQQMQEQVAGMVKDDPDAAAAMIKRWLNR